MKNLTDESNLELSRENEKFQKKSDLAYTNFYIEDHKSIARAFLLLRHGGYKFLGVVQYPKFELIDFLTLDEILFFLKKIEYPSQLISIRDYLDHHRVPRHGVDTKLE